MIKFEIQGGIIYGSFRGTSVAVETDDVSTGFNSVTNWAKKNFRDWNRIDIITPPPANTLHQIKAYKPVSTFTPRRK